MKACLKAVCGFFLKVFKSLFPEHTETLIMVSLN